MSLLQDLIAAGLVEEQAKIADTVLKQHIAGEFVPKYRFDEINTKNKDLAQELARIETEKNEAEKRAKKAEEGLSPLQEKLTQTETDWQKKYDELIAQHKQEEEDRVTLETFVAKTNAIKQALGETAYDSDLVSSFIDFEGLGYEDGKVSGVDKAIEQIKAERPFLFKSVETTSTAPKSAPTAEAGKINFGEALAKKASEADALVKAASEKYFGE